MDASERCRSVRYQTFEVFYELQNDSEYDNLCETFRGNYFAFRSADDCTILCGIHDLRTYRCLRPGFIARKLDAVTDFGSKLDSVSDITFYIVMISRVLPEYVQRSAAFVLVCGSSGTGRPTRFVCGKRDESSTALLRCIPCSIR